MTGIVQVTSSLFVDNDKPAKWIEVYRISGALQVLFDTWRKSPPENLEGDEFAAAKTLLSHVMASSGLFIDSVQTATTQQELFDIHSEFMVMVRSRMGTF